MSIEPGLHHGIPNVVYQAGLVDPHPLQSTYAKNLITGSPAEFIWRRDHREEKSYFDAGQALHELVLEGQFTSVEVLPFDNWRTKASQEAKAAAYAAGQTPMLERDLVDVYAMAKAVRESELAQSVLTNGHPEVSALAVDPETGLTLQARFDWLSDLDKPRPTVVDVKTTAKGANPRSFNREAADLRYHFSASFYSRVLTALGYPEPRFLWLVVGKDAPHSVSVIEYSEVDRLTGDALVDRALRIYAECTSTGVWPGWDTQIHQSSLPFWAHDEASEFTDIEMEVQ